MPDPKIIERIRKLLELADETRGGTEAERERAAEMAQKLMLNHNIESAELHGTSAPGDVGDDSERIEGSTSEWKVNLILSLGRVCFVDGYYTQRARFVWDVTTIGRADNISFVKTLCEHLVPWLEQEAKDAFRKVKREDPDTKPRSFKRAFYASATRTIELRLAALRSQTLKGTGVELVRNERQANKEHLERQGVYLKASRRRGYGSESGHSAGAEAGRRADLTPGRKLNR